MSRRPAPVVVTDLHEPLYVVHGRIMRMRLMLFGVWLVGWVVSGILWRDGWLATAILLGSGPGVWIVVWLFRAGRPPGRREPVSRRALGGPGAGSAH